MSRHRTDGGRNTFERLRSTLSRVADAPNSSLTALEARKHFWVSAHDMGKQEPLSQFCDEFGGKCSENDIVAQLAAHGSVLRNTADTAERPPTGFNAPQDVALICNAGDSDPTSESCNEKVH